MDQQQLRAQLEQLQAELQRTKDGDTPPPARFQVLTKEIQEMLDREANQAHHYQSLSERLSESVAELEASHPQITALMRSAIDSLAVLGI